MLCAERGVAGRTRAHVGGHHGEVVAGLVLIVGRSNEGHSASGGVNVEQGTVTGCRFEAVDHVFVRRCAVGISGDCGVDRCAG